LDLFVKIREADIEATKETCKKCRPDCRHYWESAMPYWGLRNACIRETDLGEAILQRDQVQESERRIYRTNKFKFKLVCYAKVSRHPWYIWTYQGAPGDVMTRESLETHLIVKGFATKEEAEKACKSLSSAWNTMNQKTGRDRSSGPHYGYWHLYVAQEGQPAYKVVVEDPDAVTFEPHVYFDKETAEQDAQAWKEGKKTSKVTFTEIERPPMWEYHMLTQNAIQESVTLSELSSDTKAQFEKLISL
jgi:hypothetical protein